jgi:Mn-dependent DtxR family transcriptional regulator
MAETLEPKEVVLSEKEGEADPPDQGKESREEMLSRHRLFSKGEIILCIPLLFCLSEVKISD